MTYRARLPPHSVVQTNGSGQRSQLLLADNIARVLDVQVVHGRELGVLKRSSVKLVRLLRLGVRRLADNVLDGLYIERHATCVLSLARRGLLSCLRIPIITYRPAPIDR